MKRYKKLPLELATKDQIIEELNDRGIWFTVIFKESEQYKTNLSDRVDPIDLLIAVTGLQANIAAHLQWNRDNPDD